MIVLSINGVNYQYPEIDDEEWGVQATQYAQAVSNILAHVFSPNLPIATSGQLRLGNNDTITWRNAANSANLSLRANTSNKLIFNDGVTDIDLTLVSPGNVQHLATATNNAIVRFDGPTGVSIQNSGVVIDDSNNIIGINDVYATSGTIVTVDGTNANFTNIDVTDLDINGSNFEDLIVNPVPLAVDNRLVKLDGPTGQNFSVTGITVSDSEDVSGINDLSVGGDVTISGTGTHSVSAEFANEIIEEYERPTGTSVGTRGVAISAAFSQTTTSATYADITDATVTIATSGRPVCISCISDGSIGSSWSHTIVTLSSSGQAFSFVRIVRDSTNIAHVNMGSVDLIPDPGASPTPHITHFGPSNLFHIDTPSAGTYTYKLQFKVNVATDTSFSASNLKLVAYEL